MKNQHILLGHGGGGKLSGELIREYFLKYFDSEILKKLDDSAVFSLKEGTCAFTTDSYVVDPIFFPGGDIGKLSVCGTVNDLSMAGAEPLYLTCGFIIEEGFAFDDLEKILQSMKDAAGEAGVSVVAGDTKVVARGSVDKVFINTSGIGMLKHNTAISAGNAAAGDKIIVSGSVGDHGIAVMSKRHGLSFETAIESDCAPLNHIVKALLDTDVQVHAMRDPTRGGIATVLNEIAAQSEVGIIIEEETIPVREDVMGACEMLGLDPFYIANEGKIVLSVSGEDAKKAVQIIQGCRYGEGAQIIGEVVEAPKKKVILRTHIGGERIIDMAPGQLLPRIC